MSLSEDIKTLLRSPEGPPPLLIETLRTLPPRERDYIACYYGLNGSPVTTYKAIGLMSCPPVTSKRVVQVIDRGLTRLGRAYRHALAIRKYHPRLPTPMEVNATALL